MRLRVRTSQTRPPRRKPGPLGPLLPLLLAVVVLLLVLALALLSTRAWAGLPPVSLLELLLLLELRASG